MKEIEIVIHVDGTIQMVHDDDAAGLFKGETVTTFRASHVEPNPSGAGWIADMRTVGGPVLGPFERRDEALNEEVRILTAMMTEGKVEQR